MIRSWKCTGASCRVRLRDGVVLRVDAFADAILRVRYSRSGLLAPERAWDPVAGEQPPVVLSTRQQSGALVLEAGGLAAYLDLELGTLGFRSPNGIGFADDESTPEWRETAATETFLARMPDAELPPGPARVGVLLDKHMAPDEGYFGFGQRTGCLERSGRRLTNWTADPCSPGHRGGDDNLYQAHPFFMAVRPGFAWGLFLHSSWYSAFDVGAARAGTLTLFTLGGALDYFIFAGPTPAAVVEQLTRLTGRPALPPLWALGFHQSRWSYRSDDEVRAVADGFRRRRIPLDAIHLDIDYMDGFRVFRWSRHRFPDPAATMAALHVQGVRAVTIVDPGVKKEIGAGYPVVDEGLAGSHFVRGPDGELFSGWVWPGESLFPDFCRAATRRWWGELHRDLLDIGVDGIWCDMNEPAISDNPLESSGGRERPIPLSAPTGDTGEAPHAETHNLYGLLMSRATSEGMARLRPGRRPWVLTRSAFTGVQRWAATWMGDNASTWEQLATSLPQIASMGLCGAPHTGADIGGFYGDCPGELFARWIELGAFYPFMRGHAHHASPPQEPWVFGPEIEAVSRGAIELRYRLLPYLYTLAHRAHRSGEPLLRPLLYDFPDATDLHRIDDQAMLGSQLMIAPVLRPGERGRAVAVPPGTWYDFHTGARVEGGTVDVDAPLGRPPILVRGGAVLTLGNIRASTAEPVTELLVAAYPVPGVTGHWTLIEDDGESFAFRDGVLAETSYAVTQSADHTMLTICPRVGRYRVPPRSLVLRLHLSRAPACVLVDDREYGDWRWSDGRNALELGFADDGAGHRVEAIGPA